MPDNDIVPRKVRRRWGRAFQLMLAGHEPVLIGRAVDRALTETVKAAELPSPHRLVQAIRDADLASDTAALEAAFAEYVRLAGGYDIGLDILSEARVFYELRRADLHSTPEEAITHDLVAGALRRHATRSLTGSEDVADAMIATGMSLPAIADRQRACLDEAQYEAIAAQVIDGNAARARTPNSQVPKPDLADLLNQEI